MSTAFTEPDLLTLGERVAVDDASLVAHINTRGYFKLNPLVVGDRCVLRTGSRLLSGASMGTDSCLLEHTLIMAGDEVDVGATCQGWPADAFDGQRVRLEKLGEETDVSPGLEGTENNKRRWWMFDFGNILRGKQKYERIGVGAGESWALT